MKKIKIYSPIKTKETRKYAYFILLDILFLFTSLLFIGTIIPFFILGMFFIIYGYLEFKISTEFYKKGVIYGSFIAVPRKIYKNNEEFKMAHNRSLSYSFLIILFGLIIISFTVWKYIV